MQKPVYVLNGPSLNLLGEREPEIYGYDTLADIEARLKAQAQPAGLDIVFRQSNHEGTLVDWIQEARKQGSGLIVNPAGYGHSSVAILDALLSAANIPCIEVHLSNIYRRDAFRQQSYVSKGVTGVVCGFGALGYELALQGVMRIVARDEGLAATQGATRPNR